MTRVLHVSRNFHPHAGGTEQFIASLARHTRPLGIESSVLCTDRHPSGDAPPPEIPVLRVATWGPDRLQTARCVRGAARELLRAADVVHFHDLRFGLDLPRRARARTAPTVLSTHGLVFHTDEHAWTKRLAWRTVYLPALRRCRVVIADSEHDYSRVSELPQARLIENPVDVDDFLAIADDPPSPDGPLVYFGRLAPNKGIDLLAPVLHQDRRLRLVVIGTGEPAYVEELRRGFEGLPVELTGSLPRAAVVERLRAASAIVLPSRREGFGITLVEAMATGRPIVASRIPPFRALTAGTTVELVDCADPAALVAAIGRATRQTDGRSTVAHARSYSWAARATEFAALYESLVAKAAGDA